MSVQASSYTGDASEATLSCISRTLSTDSLDSMGTFDADNLATDLSGVLNVMLPLPFGFNVSSLVAHLVMNSHCRRPYSFDVALVHLQ